MNSQLLILAAVVMVIVFLARQLRRIARRYNATDWGSRGLNLLDGLNRWYCQRFHRLNKVQLDIPDSGSAVVVSNHVSGLDPLLLVAASRRPLRFLIARAQYQRFGLNWLFRAVGCIPVDHERRPHLALRAALQHLRRGEVVALFPHGKIHLDTDPPRKLKPGAARLAMEAGGPLIPVRITGVRAQGHVILAVFIRSRVSLTTFPPIETDGLSLAQILDQTANVLDGRQPFVRR